MAKSNALPIILGVAAVGALVLFATAAGGEPVAGDGDGDGDGDQGGGTNGGGTNGGGTNGGEEGGEGEEGDESSGGLQPPVPPPSGKPILELLGPIFNDRANSPYYAASTGMVPLINFRYDSNGNLLGWAILKVPGNPIDPEPNKRVLVNVEGWLSDGSRKVSTIIPNTTLYAWNVASNWQTTRTMTLPLAAHKVFHPTAKVFLNPDTNGTWMLSGLWEGAISRAK